MTRDESMQQARERREQVLRLRSRGLTDREIGLLIGVSESRVWQMRRKAKQDISFHVEQRAGQENSQQEIEQE